MLLHLSQIVDFLIFLSQRVANLLVVQLLLQLLLLVSHQLQLSVQVLLLPVDCLPLKVLKVEPLFFPVVGLLELPLLDLFQVVLQIIFVELL